MSDDDFVARMEAKAKASLPVDVGFAPLVPLTTTSHLPPFPVHLLTPWVATYAQEVAASTRFSVDMAAGFALGAISAALGGCVEVMPSDDWREPVNLYLAIVAEPSEGKSPVFKRMMAPIFELNKALHEKHAPRVAQDLADRKVDEGRLAKMQADLQRRDDAATREDMHELAAKLKDPVKPAPRLAVQDVTAETLAVRMAEQNERLAILSPEDTLWGHIGGRYNENPSVELYLSAYSSEPVIIDRMTRSISFSRPSLTICVAMQPAVLMGRGTRLAEERGLLARFLYVAPRRVVGSRDHSEDPPRISEVAQQNYHHNLTSLAEINRVACRERQQLRLGPEARAVWREWQNALEARRGEDGDLYPIRGWAGKAEGSALRLAGTLAMADGTMVVTAAIMRRAFAMMEYFEAHAKAAIGLTTATDDTRAAARALAWIERTMTQNGVTPLGGEVTPLRFLTHRDIWKAHRSAFTSVSARAACDLLCEHGYLQEAKRGKASGYHVRPLSTWRTEVG